MEHQRALSATIFRFIVLSTCAGMLEMILKYEYTEHCREVIVFGVLSRLLIQELLKQLVYFSEFFNWP